jgi:6-phosphogluconolactonase
MERAPIPEPEAIICRDLSDLNARAADRFVARAGKAVTATGRFAVALSGGSTPKGLYELLASPPFRERVAWSGVHLFWGDERCVPPDHPQSNYRMAEEALLAKVPIPAQNVHRMAGEKEPRQAAAEYEGSLKTFIQPAPCALPSFDLILLGLGEDGHTASLFPDTEALDETESLAAACYVEQLRAYRLTLTLPVLNAAAEVVFLVSGRSKAPVVKEILKSKVASRLPAAQIRPRSGRLTWFITHDAAAEIQPTE